MGELTPVGGFELVDVSNIRRNLAENFEGLTPSFVTVKFPTAGATVWEVGEEALKMIEGIIVDHHAIRALFSKPIGEGSDKVPPDCSSRNGIAAEEGGIGQSEDGKIKLQCKKCKYNAWGSYNKYIKPDKESNRKACNERHRVFILRSGEILPTLVAIPATSIGNLQEYMTKIVTKGKHYSSIITGISLEKTNNKDNIEYSKAVFKRLSDVPQEKMGEIAQLVQFLKDYCRAKPIEEEVSTEEEPF
jgi:hypothetical protein